MKREIHIASLITAQLSGQISEGEKQELNLWLELSAENSALFDRINDHEQLAASILELRATDTDYAFQQVKERIAVDSTLLRKFLPIKWLSAAAAIFIVFSIGIYHYSGRPTGKDIAPGGNRATLTLANGLVIDLNEGKAGITIHENEINYNDGTQVTPGLANAQLVTLSTPKGGQYKVTLPDGSTVWLNAGSSLTYPTKFNNESRHVELKGEAYFEVASIKSKALVHGKVPFKVKTAHQEVEVLGTQFNINAYNDEPATKTTLAEGSVRVTSGKNALKLVPGQQSVVKGEKIEVREVNLKQALAWKNGYIEFYNADIYEIMRSLSRWYNIDVVYEGDLKDALFGGSVSKYKNISEVLTLLEETGEVHFRIEPETSGKGRRITVMR